MAPPPFATEDAKLAARYGGRVPRKRPWLQARLKERKYFDSGDYALSKAGKADKQEVGREIPTPEALGAGTVETDTTTEPMFDSNFDLQPEEGEKATETWTPAKDPEEDSQSYSSPSETSSPASSNKNLVPSPLLPRSATLPTLATHVHTSRGSSPSPLVRTNSLASPILVPSGTSLPVNVHGSEPTGVHDAAFPHPHPDRPLVQVSTIPIRHANTPHGRSSVSGSFSCPTTACSLPGSSGCPQMHLRPRSASHLCRESFSASDARAAQEAADPGPDKET